MASPSILMLTTNVDAGAGRAALRHHQGLLSSGYDSELWYLEGSTSEIGCKRISTLWLTASRWPKKRLRKFATKYLADPEPGFKSLSIFPSGLVSRINSHRCDLVQLNWICDFLSIKDIGKIRKPIVWRFSDMWPLLGSQHYSDKLHSFYQQSSISNSLRIDKTAKQPGILDRWLWKMKLKNWRGPLTICCPSRWLADLTRLSGLATNWSIFVTGTLVDTDIFKPSLRDEAKRRLGISPETKLVLMGSRNNRDDRKGFQLFSDAIKFIGFSHQFQIVGFGLGVPDSIHGRKVLNLGPISTEQKMAFVLSAADVTVIPSKLDNLPQLGLEALSCGCPLVGFDSSGMTELIIPGVTGALAVPFDSQALAEGILEVLYAKEPEKFRARCRQYALEKYSGSAVISRYQLAYESSISMHQSAATRYPEHMQF